MINLLEKNMTVSIGKDHYKTVVTSRTHTLTVDEPTQVGGSDTAANPKEHLLAALGACTAITLRMYADRKEWNVEKINIELNMDDASEGNETTIVRTISFTGNLTDEQKQRLLKIADACPVHKVLSNPIKINTSIR